MKWTLREYLRKEMERQVAEAVMENHITGSMKTIEQLAPGILHYLSQEPAERKYWRAGYTLRDLSVVKRLWAYDTETAALKARERYAKEPAKCIRTDDSPYQVTRQELSETIRSYGGHTVQVLDEQAQLVEEWSV